MTSASPCTIPTRMPSSLRPTRTMVAMIPIILMTMHTTTTKLVPCRLATPSTLTYLRSRTLPPKSARGSAWPAPLPRPTQMITKAFVSVDQVHKRHLDPLTAFRLTATMPPSTADVHANSVLLRERSEAASISASWLSSRVREVHPLRWLEPEPRQASLATARFSQPSAPSPCRMQRHLCWTRTRCPATTVPMMEPRDLALARQRLKVASAPSAHHRHLDGRDRRPACTATRKSHTVLRSIQMRFPPPFMLVISPSFLPRDRRLSNCSADDRPITIRMHHLHLRLRRARLARRAPMRAEQAVRHPAELPVEHLR